MCREARVERKNDATGADEPMRKKGDPAKAQQSGFCGEEEAQGSGARPARQGGPRKSGLCDDEVSAALWWRGVVQTSNESFLPLFWDESRYLVLMGGGGSGKSAFAGRKVVERCACEAGHRFLVCRKVAKTLRQSCFQQLKELVRLYCPGTVAKINESDMRIVFLSGSELLFAGLDDVEKLKSIYEITDIWVEEASELLEADFDQLDIRMRGKSPHYRQMILTFNPISVTHWLKKRFFDRKDPRATVHHSTYLDNRFLSEEDRLTLEAFKETDLYYYTVYCLGEWGVTGKTVFDGKLMQQRLAQLQKPLEVGQFAFDYDGLQIRNIRWQPDSNGCICLYQRPQVGYPYVIGGDTAGEGSDYFVGQVIDNVSGKQVAKLRHQVDEDQFAQQMYCLGKWFNDAMLAVEVNFSTFPQKELERLGYRNFYVRQVEDEFTGKLRDAFGFRTDRLTRPPAVANLVRLFREHPEIVVDKETLLEMMTFVRNEEGRPEAEQGAHDDCVFALAIAFYCRDQQRCAVELPKAQRAQWTEDMREDFERAGPAERKRMISVWGNPS